MNTKNIPNVVQSVDRYGRQILTVGNLRQMIEHLSDDDHVAIATEEWFVNVAAVGRPVRDEDGYSMNEFECLTLFPGSDLDERQF